MGVELFYYSKLFAEKVLNNIALKPQNILLEIVITKQK